MRVGLIIYGELDTRTGGYLYDRKLVAGLQTLGDTVQVISLPWRRYLLRLGDNISRSLRIRLEDASLDLLLQDELNHPSLFALNRDLAARLSCPIFSIVHHLRVSENHPFFLRPFYRWVETRYLQSVDGVLCNSEATLHSTQSLAGEIHPHIVLHPGRDHIEPQIRDHEIAARAHEPGPLRVLYLGSVSPRKGLQTLLEAASSLPAQTLQLRVVGDPSRHPSYARAMRRTIREKHLDDLVTLLGPLPDAEVHRHLQRSHVLCVPSRYEGFGIVYLEAMGYGVVPIGGAAGGAAEIIEGGETGYLLPPGEVERLANVLHSLAHDRERLALMGLNARRHFLQHPTWDDVARRAHAFLTRHKDMKKDAFGLD
jgi:glycosyltransferase involved in cell wall biosynthesis